MTERQNLISLLRRQGYDRIPVEFNFCPHLEKVYRENTRTFKNYRSYFKMPWESVGGLFVSPTHLLEPEVPWENILAYVDACRHFC